MLKRPQFGAALILLLLVLASIGAQAEKIADIHPTAYVTDLAGVLDQATFERVNSLCRTVDEKTGAQIAVVTVRSLEGQPVEDYAVDLFKHLGVGGKKDDRGVLLLLSPQERRYRIEVGYGLEPVINDARAGDIGRAMVPLLRQNDYRGAPDTGVTQLSELITSGGTQQTRKERKESGRSVPLGVLAVFALLVFSLIGLLKDDLRPVREGGRRRNRSSWWIGPMGGGGFGGFGGGGGGGGFGGSSGGFGGFGGGSSGGGGASGSW
jgi:uncharacterized protein